MLQAPQAALRLLHVDAEDIPSDQGGDIEVDYTIEVDHALAGRNVFRINVKESESGLGSLKQ